MALCASMSSFLFPPLPSSSSIRPPLIGHHGQEASMTEAVLSSFHTTPLQSSGNSSLVLVSCRNKIGAYDLTLSHMADLTGKSPHLQVHFSISFRPPAQNRRICSPLHKSLVVSQRCWIILSQVSLIGHTHTRLNGAVIRLHCKSSLAQQRPFVLLYSLLSNIIIIRADSMDAGSAPPPCYQAGPDVPTDIFKPLLFIAQQNYHPDEVKEYYRTMVRHLRRMGAQNVDAAYTLMTPASDRKVSLPVSEAAMIQATIEQSDDHVSPKTVPILEEPAFEPSYEPGQFDHLETGPSTDSGYAVLDESLTPVSIEVPPPQPPRPNAQQQQQSTLMMTTSFDPPPTRPIAMDQGHARSISADHIPFTMPLQQMQTQWLPQNAVFNPASSPPLQEGRFAPTCTPSPMPHQMALPNNALGFGNPFPSVPQQHQQQQMYYHPQQVNSADNFHGPLSNNFGISNFSHDLYSNSLFPMIDVIPSRKRRKALQKGVRRITQSIPLPRQGL